MVPVNQNKSQEDRVPRDKKYYSQMTSYEV